jgi:hypothetical protein
MSFKVCNLTECCWDDHIEEDEVSEACSMRWYAKCTQNVGFEVFMVVTMKNSVIWDVVLCGFIINRRFGGMYLFHLQGRRNNASEELC